MLRILDVYPGYRILTFIPPGSRIRFATLPRGYIDQWSQICITLMKSWNRIRIEMKSRFRIHITVKRWIRTRIRIEVMRIRNPDVYGTLLYYG